MHRLDVPLHLLAAAELTTDLPSRCTWSISFSAFALSYPKYFWKTKATYDIRLTGSFHTIVTHGLARKVTSSGVTVGSTSTGLVALTNPIVAHARPLIWGGEQPRRRVDRAPHRPLRADHAAGVPGQRNRPPPVGLRALPAPAPRGATVRRRGGGWDEPSTPSNSSVSTTTPWPCWPDVVNEETLDWLRGYRFSGIGVGLRRGRHVLPVLTARDRGGQASPRRSSWRRCCCRSTTTTRPWRLPPPG